MGKRKPSLWDTGKLVIAAKEQLINGSAALESAISQLEKSISKPRHQPAPK